MRVQFQAYGTAAAVICLSLAVFLSHLIEPGIRIQRLTLAGETPAIRFSPAPSNSQHLVLMAHGVTASKETLFRFGEALACAGFVCYAVDLPGHGESSRRFSPAENSDVLARVARELGPINVFIGHSMGAGAGAQAVRDGRLSLKLFIAAGANPYLGEHGPPLLLLAGRFEEFHPPSQVQSRTDATLVLSPWSDHALETYDPLLVNAAVESACSALGKTPPAPRTRWLWRLAGLLLGLLSALLLAICFPELPPEWKWARGPIISALVILPVILTSGTWLGAAPVIRRVPMQLLSMSIAWLLLWSAAKIKFPIWTVSALSGGSTLCCALAAVYTRSGSSWNPFFRFFSLFAALGALVVFAGTAIGCLALRRGTRRDADLAMSIFIGYALGQWMPVFL